MIGIQSSVIMFPINLLIVSIFRNTRPRERDTKTITSKQKKTGQVSPSQNSSPQKQMKDITPDTVIKVKKLICVFEGKTNTAVFSCVKFLMCFSIRT